jgi:enoyl-CoA hydratase/carnithine racemase
VPGLVHLDSYDDGVTVVRLDNPPVNALSRAVLAEIGAVANALARDAAVKAVVLTGEGKAFAAGADISEFGGADRAREITNGFRAAFDAVAGVPRPVIAAVNGVALGGGMELALACDLRVVADTARLGQPEILLGIIPGAGATQRLPRLVGPARAKELVWSGRQVGADEALAIGLADRVAPATELVETALAWASELAAGAVVAMGLAKAAIDRGLDGPLGPGLDIESDAFAEVFDTDDAAAGVRSFLEHGPGKATFQGR